jgi:hypothetical protein
VSGVNFYWQAHGLLTASGEIFEIKFTGKIAMLFDTFHHFTPQDFVFKIARTREELDGYWALRRGIFCEEQKVFQGSDRDAIDERAMPIVCESLIAGMEDSVVGVVRIDEREPGLWYGSRLGVAASFRSVKRLSPSVAARNHQPVFRGLGALGAGLIYKAVSTAHAIGCHEFLATVQHQNARFFQRLHWEPLEELELFGIPHVRMRADLGYYRPAESVF